MWIYITRRMLYAIPILLGVNILLFALFFFVFTPDDMARTILGEKHATPEMIENWKREHSYHLPTFINTGQSGSRILTDTIFWQKSVRLLLFQFGKSDHDGNLIWTDLKERIPRSLYITIPVFLASLLINIFLAMTVAFYRGTYVDYAALAGCVVLMSVSGLLYILAGQFFFAKLWRLVPISGFDYGIYSIKFLMLPVAIGVIQSIGGGVRYYRTVFLEEINKDYVRTARAKGLDENVVLFKHALKNAMLPILTNVVVSIPFLIMGNLLLEKFFGIPGLGGYTIDAIQKQDFAVIRAMVFLGSCLYIVGLIAVDISYTWVDPRIRLG